MAYFIVNPGFDFELSEGERMNQLYDVNGAAQVLAVSPWTIRAYIRQGKLNAVRIGRLVRLEQGDLEQFVLNARCNRNQHKNETSEVIQS
jgi:excisionase family DNA binding protein